MDQIYQASFAALHVPTGPPDLCKAKGFTLQDCTPDTVRGSVHAGCVGTMLI